MTKIKNIISILSVLLVFSTSLKAQSLTTQQKEYQENKIEIFTVKERDNLQYWLNEELEKMNLSEETESEYLSILTSYIAKMGRLVDKDKNYSKEKILEKMDDLVARQNKAIKKILSKEDFKIHLEAYDKLMLSIKNRIEESEI